MRISPHQIPHEGREVDLTMDEKWAREGVGQGVGGKTLSLNGQLFLRAYEAQIRVTGTVDSEVELVCDRCAKDLRWSQDGELDLSYLPIGSRDDGSRALASDELDIGFYPLEGLDLGRVLQEFFALEVPGRLSCDAPNAVPLEGESCSPLGTVQEPTKRADHRFAALAGLKLSGEG